MYFEQISIDVSVFKYINEESFCKILRPFNHTLLELFLFILTIKRESNDSLVNVLKTSVGHCQKMRGNTLKPLQRNDSALKIHQFFIQSDIYIYIYIP